MNIIPNSQKFEVGKTEPNEASSEEAMKFPKEYAVSGWFKWRTVKMEPWHLAFRLHINKGEENANVAKLGDRGLALWPSNSGVYAFATYTYTNLNGAGNPNVYQTVSYGKEMTAWHFIYFGYSRELKKAVAYV